MNLERRDSPRIPFEQDVIVYAQGRRLSCRSADLSAGGICLQAPERARPGQHVIVDMGLEAGVPLAVEGFIVRAANDGAGRRASAAVSTSEQAAYIWGVRFHGLAPRVQSMLSAHVEQHVEQQRVVVAPRRPRAVDVRCGSPAPSREARMLGPKAALTLAPVPPPAFKLPEPTVVHRDNATRSEPTPAFTLTPPPVPALPRSLLPEPRFAPPRAAAGPNPRQSEVDRRRAELYRRARERAEREEER